MKFPLDNVGDIEQIVDGRGQDGEQVRAFGGEQEEIPVLRRDGNFGADILDVELIHQMMVDHKLAVEYRDRLAV